MASERASGGTSLAGEQERIAAEAKEIDLLAQSTRGEVQRLAAREQEAKKKLEGFRAAPADA
ncbi:MAG: hypothetical protein ACRDM0_24340, partial [Thermoleophilaceae bacterium]